MSFFPEPVNKLIGELMKLPGIGPKSAQRLAFYILRCNRDAVVELAKALVYAKDRTRTCKQCFNLSDQDLCPICRDPRRDDSLLCVVQDSRDVVALEKTREFTGRYHVLQGAISPMEGVGPEQLTIKELLRRVQANPDLQEVIMATNPN